jgi:hypothetical protein
MIRRKRTTKQIMVNKTLHRTKMAMTSWFIVLYIVRTFCGYQKGIQKP